MAKSPALFLTVGLSPWVFCLLKALAGGEAALMERFLLLEAFFDLSALSLWDDVRSSLRFLLNVCEVLD